MEPENPPRASQRGQWLLALASLAFALVCAEGLLRFALFRTSIDSAAKNPDFYAFDADEVWVYRHLFSSSGRWAIVADRQDAAADTAIPFYRKWATSLEPDAELGWARKANVRTPCHETTNVASRGIHDYAAATPKILLFGDSFVESAACSNDTLATKVERLTGIDTLNYGVGGYGLDQMLLYVRRMVPARDGADRLVLVGLIQDDLNRVLLEVRDGPKPYFTIDGGRLVLHTSHIHPASLNDIFERPRARSYLYYFVRGSLGYPIYRDVLEQTRDARRQAARTLSLRIVEEFADLRQQRHIDLAFFVLPTPGAPFDREVLGGIRAQQLPVLDLQGCLAESGRPDTELFAELHPTSLANDLLARCLVRGLTALGMLR